MKIAWSDKVSGVRSQLSGKATWQRLKSVDQAIQNFAQFCQLRLDTLECELFDVTQFMCDHQLSFQFE